MRAGTGFHGNDAARRQLGAPGDEFIAYQSAAAQHVAGGIHSVNLDHALGQVDPDAYGFSSRMLRGASWNLFHGLPRSQA